MRLFDAHISNSVFSFLKDNINKWETAEFANTQLQKACGIADFFYNNTEFQYLGKELWSTFSDIACESRAEYGDFQTNPNLALQITNQLKREGASPQIVIEPTCGKGHFIIAALNAFDTIEKIFGIEIQKMNHHIDLFRNRKSSIYKGKCDFSIFGIGDYSFKPYKIAISGLYKTFHFCLVTPQNEKPVMLDDTCYFIGFDNLKQAEYVWQLLNTETVTDFLKSISFKDSKRMITKEVLMRIDLRKVAQSRGEKEYLFDNTNERQELQLSLFA